MNFSKEYTKLNEKQREAVDTIDGPVAVIAGPGTGKTQLLSMRVANILDKTDTDPGNILCLTFTEAAAENMRTRINGLIGTESEKIQIFTFHGLGTYIINEYPEYFYDQPALKHLDELGEYSLLENLMSKLKHNNPLSKKVGDDFLHIRTIINCISWLKQAGLSPDEIGGEVVRNRTFFKDTSSYINGAFKDTPSVKNIPKYTALYEQLKKTLGTDDNQTAIESIEELRLAIDETDENGRYATPITSWRNKWLTQRLDKWKYKDQQRYEILAELSNLYAQYQTYLNENGLYTFDDMILRTLVSINKNDDLKFSLQEKYQYILVDEYQDTNGAQERLLIELSDSKINENKPNLMVVGDDDQAIYRFQGAKNSVIYDFIERWQDPRVVVLKDSYRNGQNLLDMSREVISRVDERLESLYPEIDKHLISQNKSKLFKISSDTETENYINTAQTIKALIDKGEKPSSIAVLAPKHKYLEALLPYLTSLKIPVDYERREQILKQPRITEIIDLLRVIESISEGRVQLTETILSRILAAPYWNLSTEEWWELAISAQKEHRGWIKTLENSNDDRLKNFVEAIKIIGKDSKNLPFDLVLAQVLGNRPIIMSDESSWDMPWREFYFDSELIKKDPSSYMQFIGQFNTLTDKFSEWIPQETRALYISDFLNFVGLYTKSNLPLIDTSPYVSSPNSVKLSTVYKAKGLEWDNVFVLNAQENVWGPKTRTKNLSFKLPLTLSWIEPRQNDDNDLLRLLYVALTRVKNRLFITDFELTDNGKPAAKLLWLDQFSFESYDKAHAEPVPKQVLIASYEDRWRNLYTNPTTSLTNLLKPLLKDYKLSASHLNDFLSVDRGGPQFYLMSRLLRVPDVINPNAMFGDAVHKSLEYLQNQLSETGTLPTIGVIQKYFSDKLRSYPLTEDEFELLNGKGRENLSYWMKLNKDTFSKDDISEHNFARENVVVEDAKLTGKIDLIRVDDGSSTNLTDYKTSRPLSAWTNKNQNDNLRAYNYRRQLVFYKILLDHSSLSKKHKVTEGTLDFLTPDEESRFIKLNLTYDREESDRLIKLIKIVWDKIQKLDLPNTDIYPATLTGIKQFEEDLLSHKI